MLFKRDVCARARRPLSKAATLEYGDLYVSDMQGHFTLSLKHVRFTARPWWHTTAFGGTRACARLYQACVTCQRRRARRATLGRTWQHSARQPVSRARRRVCRHAVSANGVDHQHGSGANQSLGLAPRRSNTSRAVGLATAAGAGQLGGTLCAGRGVLFARAAQRERLSERLLAVRRRGPVGGAGARRRLHECQQDGRRDGVLERRRPVVERDVAGARDFRGVQPRRAGDGRRHRAPDQRAGLHARQWRCVAHVGRCARCRGAQQHAGASSAARPLRCRTF